MSSVQDWFRDRESQHRGQHMHFIESTVDRCVRVTIAYVGGKGSGLRVGCGAIVDSGTQGRTRRLWNRLLSAKIPQGA